MVLGLEALPELKALGKHLQHLDATVSTLVEYVDKLDTEVNDLNANVGELNEKLGGVDVTLNHVDGKLGGLDKTFASMDPTFAGIGDSLANVAYTLHNLNPILGIAGALLEPLNSEEGGNPVAELGAMVGELIQIPILAGAFVGEVVSETKEALFNAGILKRPPQQLDFPKQ